MHSANYSCNYHHHRGHHPYHYHTHLGVSHLNIACDLRSNA
jgi:hypothetical protein